MCFYTVMFQSVVPRPGKIAFQVEPFPIPDFQVLPEASKVTALPVAEPVAVSQEVEVQVEELLEVASVAKDSPFLMATEVEDELVLPEAPAVVEKQICESPVECVVIESLESSDDNQVIEIESREEGVSDIEVEKAPVKSDPFARIEDEEVSNGIAEVFESSSSAQSNPFKVLETAATEESTEAASEASEFYEQPVTEAPVAAQNPAVMSWQPPAPCEKKKSAKLAGFFRQ